MPGFLYFVIPVRISRRISVRFTFALDQMFFIIYLNLEVLSRNIALHLLKPDLLMAIKRVPFPHYLPHSGYSSTNELISPKRQSRFLSEPLKQFSIRGNVASKGEKFPNELQFFHGRRQSVV